MKNLILGMAENYGVDELSAFVRSLHSSGVQGDIVLFVGHGVSGDVLELLKAHDVQTVVLSRRRRLFAACRPLVALLRQWRRMHQDASAFLRDRWKQHVANARYAYYREYLRAHGGRYQNVLLTDVRDVIWQGDPFSRPLDSEVCLFAEHACRTIGTSGSTAKWINRCYGTIALQKLSAQPVVCAGVILGSVAGVSLLIEEIVAMMASSPAFWSLRFGLDQAALSLLVYDRGIPGVTVYSCLDGPVAHLALVPKEEVQVNGDGCVLGRDGAVVPVLHQYDRHDCLHELIRKAA